MTVKYISPFVLLSICVCALSSCEKQLEITIPQNIIPNSKVYETDGGAASALAGIYTGLSASQLFTLSIFPGLSADELVPFKTTNLNTVAFYRNDVRSGNIQSANYWGTLYGAIVSCNSAIEGLTQSKTLTPSVKTQLLGEAKFVRAFGFFYLVNMYGGVPLPLTSAYDVNRLLARSSQDSVYKQIVQDLKEAESSLSERFLDGLSTNESIERLKPTKWSAAALLARVYLYLGNYAEAEAKASKVIEQSQLFHLVPLNEAFLKNNAEAIWQIQPVNNFDNTSEARWLSVLSSQAAAYLSDDVLNQFEAGDLRRTNWIDSATLGGQKYLYASKYKVYQTNEPVTEYSTVLRLSELFLIRAEARIQQNNIQDGIADLNIIRQRSRAVSNGELPNPLPQLSASLSDSEALAACAHERQIELFAEWGHRWFDLKRTGKIDEVMNVITTKKGGIWKPTAQLYPIVTTELEVAPNLTQTPGY
jgi:starch-binding outer membrane protein, SusD/RagB family